MENEVKEIFYVESDSGSGSDDSDSGSGSDDDSDSDSNHDHESIQQSLERWRKIIKFMNEFKHT